MQPDPSGSGERAEEDALAAEEHVRDPSDSERRQVSRRRPSSANDPAKKTLVQVTQLDRPLPPGEGRGEGPVKIVPE